MQELLATFFIDFYPQFLHFSFFCFTVFSFFALLFSAFLLYCLHFMFYLKAFSEIIFNQFSDSGR